MSYNRDNNSRGFGGGNDSYQRQMYNAVCSECGKETQVPFKPKEGLPVYCKDCYFKKKNGGKPSYSKKEDSEETY